jgi:hypothetical protein
VKKNNNVKMIKTKDIIKRKINIPNATLKVKI